MERGWGCPNVAASVQSRLIFGEPAELGEPPRPILDPLFFWDLRILCEKLTLLGLVYHKGEVNYAEEDAIDSDIIEL